MTTDETTYQTAGEYLAFETSGLAEYVTAEEMQALKDGTMPHGEIADRYMQDIDHARIEADTEATRADLLSWISWEIDASREMDRQVAKDEETFAALDRIHAFAARKKQVEARMQAKLVNLLVAAGATQATKGAIADAAGISRPTLDAWLLDATTQAGR